MNYNKIQMFSLIFFCFLPLVASQTCRSLGDGPCMNGMCPMDGHTCTSEEVCCPDHEVILPGGNLPGPAAPAPAPGPEIISPIVPPAPVPVAPAPAPAPVAGCVDNTNVKCANYKKYCTVKEYNFLLAKHCPVTCNLCAAAGSSESSGECMDRASNPRNGKSNCASMVQFCTHARYKEIMAVQCQKTCGLC